MKDSHLHAIIQMKWITSQLGNLLYSSWCDYFTPPMMYILQEFPRNKETKKCWGRHLSYLFLWQLRIKLCWLHMREHIPSYLSQMAASMLLIIIPQAKYVLIFVGGIVGGKAHLLNVPLGEGVPHSFCIACFHGSMRLCMATMIDHLSLCKVSHMFVGDMPLICIGEEFFYGLPG